MNHEKLHRFAINSISDEKEIEEILDWIEASPDNQKEFNRVKNLWPYTGFKNFGSLSKENLSKAYRPTGRTIGLNVLKYAAVFILAFLIGGLSFYLVQNEIATSELTYHEIIVPFGESTEVILADQTHVWLNSGARLKYPSMFQTESRTVELTGEAYFEVERDTKRPFKVVTPGPVVHVLGTSFNVDAFEGSRFVNVTLVEGKVTLENKEGTVLAVMSPNENATYDLTENKTEISQVSTSFYTSWKEGTIYFKDEKLVYIAQKLERWFNVEVVFDDESVKDLKFTGAILKNKPIDQIMEILKYTSVVDYSIDMRLQQPNVIHFKKMPVVK